MSEAPAPKKRTDKLVGQLLAGKYKILKKIGEGGMGSVYIATQEPIDRKVAVKVLLGKLAEDEIAVKRFEQEARAISKMQHPNTVTIYDFGRTSEDEDDRLYIVMEYLKGQTLTQVLRKDKVLAPARACKVVRQVCASLADAHATGIIHRDLKPDNIFLTEVGGDKDWVKVLDFGVAKLADSEGAGTLTQTGMIFGTPKYMSPEQAEGRPIDYRADIYALGVVLYELLVGRPPFIADTPVGLLLKHISEPPPPFSKVRPDLQIDPRLEAITMRALDKRPDARQQMVAELAAELEAFERIATGQVPAMFASGTYPAPVQGGLPTEVVPGTLPGSPVTPAGLHPPGAVPSNLSLGSVSGGTEAVGPHHPHPSGATAYGGASAQYRPADAMPTAAQGAMPTASVQMTAQGLTHPVAAHGGYAETLGGISGEISGPFPGGSAKAQKRSPLMFVGVGLLAAGVVLAGVVFATSQKPTVESVPTPPAADPGKVAALKTPEAPPPAEPPAAAPTPAEDPAPEAARTPERTPTRRPARDPAPSAPPPAPAPEATKVTLRFESEPTEALVLLAGKQLGITPFNHEFPKEADALTFVFTKDGYEKATRTVVTSRDQDVSATMDKKPEQPVVKACPDGSAPPCTVPAAVVKAPKQPKAPTVKAPPPSDKVESDPLKERVGDLKSF